MEFQKFHQKVSRGFCDFSLLDGLRFFLNLLSTNLTLFLFNLYNHLLIYCTSIKRNEVHTQSFHSIKIKKLSYQSYPITTSTDNVLISCLGYEIKS